MNYYGLIGRKQIYTAGRVGFHPPSKRAAQRKVSAQKKDKHRRLTHREKYKVYLFPATYFVTNKGMSLPH